MKNLLKLTLAILLTGYAMMSCSSDDNDDDQSGQTINVENIAAKWNVSQSNSKYSSFELMEDGKYIVEENTGVKTTVNNKIYHTGTYEIVGKEIKLNGFGVIEITSVTNDSLNFSIKLDSTPGQVISFTATKAPEITTSAKTSLLCKTWRLDTENGYIDVTFSKSGTYFIENIESDVDETLESANWKWNNATETEIAYERAGTPKGVMKVIELTESRLVISDTVDGQTKTSTFYLPTVTTSVKKRVTELKSLDPDSGKRFIFTYNADGTLANYREYYSSGDYDDNKLTYSNGLLVKQERYSSSEKAIDEIYEYTYVGDNIIYAKFTDIDTDTNERTYDQDTLIIDPVSKRLLIERNERDIAYTYDSKGNQVKNEVKGSISTYKYDTKKSMMANQGLPVWFWVHESRVNFDLYVGANNVVEENDGGYTTKYSYDYDQDGYPVKTYDDGDPYFQVTYEVLK